MTEDLPLVTVLGDAPTPPLLRPLQGIARVVQRSTLGAEQPDLVLLPSDDSLLPLVEQIQSSSHGQGQFPVLVFAENSQITSELRRMWIDVGARDLVGRHQVVEAVLRCLPGGSHAAEPGNAQGARTAGARPLSDILTTPAINERIAWPPTRDIDQAHDPVAPLAGRQESAAFLLPWRVDEPIPLVDLPAVPASNAAFFKALVDYQEIRHATLLRLGAHGTKDLETLLFRHSRANAALEGLASPPPFCPRPGPDTQALSWPVYPVGWDSTESVQILNINADSLCLSFKGTPQQSNSLWLRLRVQGGTRVELFAKSRWQRRTGRDTWELGATIEGARVQEDQPSQ